ncbi:MAG: hypothetical protein V8Q21_10880 [Akkermansia muciniphila]
MDAVQRGNVRLQKGMLVPGPFCRKRGVDSFAFRISLSRQALSFVFRPTGLFRFPLRKNYRRNRKDSFSAQSGPFPRIFLFLGMEVSPEFEKLLQDALRDDFSTRRGCLFFYSFSMAGACPGRNHVSRILVAGKRSSQPLPEPCIAAYWKTGRTQIRKREWENSRGSLKSKGKFVQGETRFFYP